MNVRLEDDDSDDGDRRNLPRIQPVYPEQRTEIVVSRASDPQRENVHEDVPRKRSTSKRPKQRALEIEDIKIDSHHSRPRKSRRYSSRKYLEHHKPAEISQHGEDQDSDDVLNDYYGGTQMPYRPLPYPHALSVGSDSDDGDAYFSRRYERISRPPPLRMDHVMEAEANVPPQYSIPLHRRSSGIRPMRLPDNTVIPEPPAPNLGGLWGRAAKPLPMKPDKPRRDFRLTLKLVLTRKGERYKGRPFVYETRSWNDTVFAYRLLKEYRSLKTDNIGWMQKVTAYKTISFVYFLQYRAFEDPKSKYGRWEITNRLPIIPREDEKARSFFMFQLKRKVRKESTLFNSLSDRPPPKKQTRDWVCRLDNLIERGVAIDLEVKETFDSVKIYLGLFLAILLSLGAALAYGFAMDHDFSTGFSIASWVLTAFGFFAAVIAAGEYFGLDGPTATLTAAEELRAGTPLDRDMMDSYRERMAW